MKRRLDVNEDGAWLQADVVLDPSDAEACCSLGVFFLHRQDAVGAARALSHARVVSAHAFDICVGRARAHAANGDRRLALLYAQAGAWIFETDKEDAGAALQRAGVLFNLSKLLEHDFIEGDRVAGLAASGVEGAAYFAKLARAYARQGDAFNSNNFYTKAIFLSAKPQYLLELSEMLLSKGFGREGIGAYSMALTLAPNNSSLCHGYSNALRKYNELSGWFDDALEKKDYGIADLLEHDVGVAKRVVRHHESARSVDRQVYFVSYTNKPEAETSRQRLNASAVEVGGVSAIAAWGVADLKATKFYERFQSILSLPRGGGYWIWKPYIILLTLLSARDGDLIFYHDAGRSGYSYEITQSLHPAFDWATSNNDGMLPGLLNNFNNINWTKRDCFVFLGCDEEKYWDGRQVQATWSFWEKNNAALSFLSKWVKNCTDPRVVTDFPNVCGEENFYNFVDHRHDQSILSLLCMREGVKAYGEPAIPTWQNSKDVNTFLAVLRNTG